MSNPVRVRFAPSPTGFLHVGGARTALFNWLWAKKNAGTFILRVEDTDVERSTEASTEQILESLQWLGLEWDEGPYYQSQRTSLYMEHLERLRSEGKVYPAFETKEELDRMREQAMAEKRNPIYNRAALRLSPEEVQERMDSGQSFVWRFKVPDEGHTVVPETLMSGESECRFDSAAIGDFIITRPGTVENPGTPLYNFVCAVDDALMGITHVIRGADHLSNAAKQVLLLQAMGYDVPVYTHLPLITRGGKKMSKRDEDADPRYPVSVSARRDLGYLREATVNFLALLGWSHPSGEEIFPLDDLIREFGLERLGKANANFDEDKYLYQNGWYIRNLPAEEIVRRTIPFLENAGLNAAGRPEGWLAEVIGLEIERCKLLSEFPPALAYFFEPPGTYEPKGARKFFKSPEAADLLAAAAGVIETAEPFTGEVLEPALRKLAEERQLGFGKVAQPIRLAVTGRTASPGLFDVLRLLGRGETARRLHTAAEAIRSGAVAANPQD